MRGSQTRQYVTCRSKTEIVNGEGGDHVDHSKSCGAPPCSAKRFGIYYSESSRPHFVLSSKLMLAGLGKLSTLVLAGLSDVQLKFMNSAGPEERDRLLLQCLEYANGDMQQATKVCSTFCNFRLTQGWSLVLSAAELEGPLRSRVHTLTEQTDRFGRGIITFSPGRLDMRNASPEAYHKMLCYVLQEVLKKQDFQKKGIVLLVDARGVGFGLLRHFVLADYKRGLGMLSGAFPAKLKAIRILHPNRALALALSIAMPLLSPKMRARVEIVAGDRARDGSFSRNLADPSALPMELSIGGSWAGSQFFWDRWIAERLGRSK